MLTRERPVPSVGQLAPVHFVNAVEMPFAASSYATCLLALRCTL
jgi:hypothetical protein